MPGKQTYGKEGLNHLVALRRLAVIVHRVSHVPAQGSKVILDAVAVAFQHRVLEVQRQMAGCGGRPILALRAPVTAGQGNPIFGNRNGPNGPGLSRTGSAADVNLGLGLRPQIGDRIGRAQGRGLYQTRLLGMDRAGSAVVSDLLPASGRFPRFGASDRHRGSNSDFEAAEPTSSPQTAPKVVAASQLVPQAQRRVPGLGPRWERAPEPARQRERVPEPAPRQERAPELGPRQERSRAGAGTEPRLTSRPMQELLRMLHPEFHVILP